MSLKLNLQSIMTSASPDAPSQAQLKRAGSIKAQNLFTLAKNKGSTTPVKKNISNSSQGNIASSISFLKEDSNNSEERSPEDHPSVWSSMVQESPSPSSRPMPIFEKSTPTPRKQKGNASGKKDYEAQINALQLALEKEKKATKLLLKDNASMNQQLRSQETSQKAVNRHMSVDLKHLVPGQLSQSLILEEKTNGFFSEERINASFSGGFDEESRSILSHINRSVLGQLNSIASPEKVNQSGKDTMETLGRVERLERENKTLNELLMKAKEQLLRLRAISSELEAAKTEKEKISEKAKDLMKETAILKQEISKLVAEKQRDRETIQELENSIQVLQNQRSLATHDPMRINERGFGILSHESGCPSSSQTQNRAALSRSMTYEGGSLVSNEESQREKEIKDLKERLVQAEKEMGETRDNENQMRAKEKKLEEGLIILKEFSDKTVRENQSLKEELRRVLEEKHETEMIMKLIEQRETEKNQLVQRVNELEEHLVGMERSLEKKEQLMSKAQSSLEKTNEVLEQKEAEIEKLKGTIREKESVSQVEGELNLRLKELRENEERVEEEQKRIGQVQNELQSKKGSLEETERSLKEMEKSIKDKEKGIQEKERELQKQTRELEVQRNELEERRNENEGTEALLKEMTEELKKNREITEELLRTRENLKKAQEKIEKLEHENEKLKNDSKGAQWQKGSKEPEKLESTNELVSSSSQMETEEPKHQARCKEEAVYFSLENNSIKEENQQLKAECLNLRKGMMDLAKNLEKSQNEQKELRKMLIDLEDEKEREIQEVSFKFEQKRQLCSQRDSVSGENRRLLEEIKILNEEISIHKENKYRLIEENYALKEEMINLEEELKKVQKETQKTKGNSESAQGEEVEKLKKEINRLKAENFDFYDKMQKMSKEMNQLKEKPIDSKGKNSMKDPKEPEQSLVGQRVVNDKGEHKGGKGEEEELKIKTEEEMSRKLKGSEKKSIELESEIGFLKASLEEFERDEHKKKSSRSPVVNQEMLVNRELLREALIENKELKEKLGELQNSSKNKKTMLIGPEQFLKYEDPFSGELKLELNEDQWSSSQKNKRELSSASPKFFSRRTSWDTDLYKGPRDFQRNWMLGQASLSSQRKQASKNYWGKENPSSFDRFGFGEPYESNKRQMGSGNPTRYELESLQNQNNTLKVALREMQKQLDALKAISFKGGNPREVEALKKENSMLRRENEQLIQENNELRWRVQEKEEMALRNCRNNRENNESRELYDLEEVPGGESDSEEEKREFRGSGADANKAANFKS